MSKELKCLYCGGQQVRHEWRTYWNGRVALSGFAFRVEICTGCGQDKSARLRKFHGVTMDEGQEEGEV